MSLRELVVLGLLRDRNIVYVIESSAYGVLFTSCCYSHVMCNNVISTKIIMIIKRIEDCHFVSFTYVFPQKLHVLETECFFFQLREFDRTSLTTPGYPPQNFRGLSSVLSV